MIRNIIISGLFSLILLNSVTSANAQESAQPRELTNTVLEKVIRYVDSAVYAVPGSALGPIRIGMRLEQVLQILGQPFRSDREGFFRRRTILIYQSGINAWLKITGDKVVEEIGLEGDALIRTEEGVGVGMPKHQVLMAYGNDFTEKDGILRYGDLGIEFTFNANRVFQMNIFAAVTPEN